MDTGEFDTDGEFRLERLGINGDDENPIGTFIGFGDPCAIDCDVDGCCFDCPFNGSGACNGGNLRGTCVEEAFV